MKKRFFTLLMSLTFSSMSQAAMHTHCESGDGLVFIDGIHYGSFADSLFKLVLVTEALGLKSTSESGVATFETESGQLVVIAKDISSAVVYTSDGRLRDVLNCGPH